MGDLREFFARVHPPSTPSLVIRYQALLRNLRAMQDLCDKAEVRLRAHGKMHKSSSLGRLQVEIGAVGLCCQTIGEAEAFMAGGIGDVLVTAPIAPWAVPRLVDLAQAGRSISVVADDPLQISSLEAAARAAGVTLEVLIDVNLGQHRTGCMPAGALPLARQIADATFLKFGGVQAYLGHLQHESDLTRRREADSAATDRLRSLVGELTDIGMPPKVVTGGGTGTYLHDLASGVFTEIQAGSYALMDVEYDNCGAPGGGAWPFEPALFIAASTVSSQGKTHAVTDAGLKAVSVDGPPARMLFGAPEGSVWHPLGDEHGGIVYPAFAELFGGSDRQERARRIEHAGGDPSVDRPSGAPDWGDLVWLQPGHCDPTINLYDLFIVADEDGSFERWPIDARRTTG